MGLTFASCAISMSDGTGLRSFSLVGTKVAFLPLLEAATAFFMVDFFTTIFFFGKAFLTFDLVAMCSPLSEFLLLHYRILEGHYQLPSIPVFWNCVIQGLFLTICLLFVRICATLLV